MTVRRRIPDEAGATVATLEVTWPSDEAVDDLTLASLATVGEMRARRRPARPEELR